MHLQRLAGIKEYIVGHCCFNANNCQQFDGVSGLSTGNDLSHRLAVTVVQTGVDVRAGVMLKAQVVAAAFELAQVLCSGNNFLPGVTAFFETDAAQ